MRVTYRRELDVKQMLDKRSVECFIPMQYRLHIIHNKKKKELVPVIHNLIFVHTTPSIIQQVKSEILFLQYMVNSIDRTKIIVPDEQMERFIAVAGTYDDQLLYFKPEELNLAKGTKVRILGGEFEGQEGIFLKVKGARDKRVVILIQGVIAVAMATIHPSLIEVVEDEKNKKTGREKVKRKVEKVE